MLMKVGSNERPNSHYWIEASKLKLKIVATEPAIISEVAKIQANM